MSRVPDQEESENTYVLDAEDAAEMARLLDQDKVINEDVNVHGFLRYPPLFPNLCSR